MELPYIPVTSNKNGTVQQRNQIAKKNHLKQFSLSPSTEQKRIVVKLGELLPLCEWLK